MYCKCSFCYCIRSIINRFFFVEGVKWYFSAIVFLIAITVAIFTPNTKQMAAILIIPQIANSEKVEKIGNGLYDLAVEWMNELKPSKKGE